MSIIKGGRVDVSNLIGKNAFQVREIFKINGGQTDLRAYVFEQDRSSTLKNLEFATNDKDVQIIIFANFLHENGSIGNISMGEVKADGSDISKYTPKEMVENGSSMFRVHSYKNGAYKFSLKDEIYFPHGFKISVVTSGLDENTEYNVAIRGYGVEH